ncbi:50S ribosomal protein L24 (mitochondrial) [Galdieria sulphuraria]|uniref:Large ribosomal subunit protein uL24c n=1 Tax=Galdieria sulphuraria TaxID=130081 RepID=M2Y3S9_GALSU|nr:50S ribosomal protein L24 (mitochondrial) [Galdieria sulphuraria]EME30474.1 50S ribosomal protein L24 (mitochondrial) [Galdieria sulphuraria]|eukprot:XP_005706994.1 50S ribosomal protein L24 (mitochondrial) [Galdieria sulphuraria]
MVHQSALLLFTARMARVSRNLPRKRVLRGKLSKEISDPIDSCVTEIRFAKKVKHRLEPWNFLPGDTVEVLNGPEKGKRSRVLLSLPESNDLVIEDTNVQTVLRLKDNGNETEEVKTEHPLKASRVSLVCPETGKPTDVVYRYLEDGTRVRVAKVSGAIVPYPQLATNVEKGKEKKPDEMKVDNIYLCTPPEKAVKKTLETKGLATVIEVEDF